jgi:hypothetical protein
LTPGRCRGEGATLDRGENRILRDAKAHSAARINVFSLWTPKQSSVSFSGFGNTLRSRIFRLRARTLTTAHTIWRKKARPVASQVSGAQAPGIRIGKKRNNWSQDGYHENGTSDEKIKRTRAQGGCPGTIRRRRTWQAAKSYEEPQAGIDS